MKFLGVILALVAAPALAQQLPVRLDEGASWTFTAIHDRQIDGQPDKSFSVTTTKALTWHAAGGDKGHLRMEHVSVAANSGPGPAVALTQTLTVPVEFDVDETLAPTRIRNIDEVREATRKMIAQVGGDPDRAADIGPGVLDRTASALVGRELQVLARAQGSDLKLGAPATFEDQLPNPMGGPAIRAVASYTLESFDRDSGRAVIAWRQTLDPQSMKTSMAAAGEAMMAKVAPERRDEAKAAFAAMRMTRDETCRNEIDIATGLAVKVDCTLTLSVVDQDKALGSTEHWAITQTLPGKPR